MIIDKELVMSEAQAVTASAASEVVIDQGAAGDAYEGMRMQVVCKETATAAGAGTCTISLQTCAESGFSSPTTLFSTSALSLAQMVVKANLLTIRLPKGALRYIRTYYTVATGPLTAGKFDAFLTPDVRTV